MMKPSVAIVLPPRERFAPGGAGAIGLLVHLLAAREGGFAATVIGPEPGMAPFADVRFRAARPSWFPGNLARRYAGGVAKVLRTAPPVLVEVHNRPDVAGFLARRFPRLPVVLFLHNDPRTMRGAGTEGERAALAGRLARVVAVSEYLGGRFGAAAVVLPNAIDLGAVPRGVEKEKLILFAGRVVSDKGADAFVAACGLALPHLPGWRAEMIGADRFGADSPETGWIAALRPKAAAAGVAMRGYLPHGAVLAAMARAAIVVVPSRWAEPFGLTALEAMAAGAALAFSPRGGLPEVAGAAGVRIDPDDPETMAQAIVSVARDPARLAALGRDGQERARLFGVDRIGPQLDALRADVLDAWLQPPRQPI